MDKQVHSGGPVGQLSVKLQPVVWQFLYKKHMLPLVQPSHPLSQEIMLLWEPCAPPSSLLPVQWEMCPTLPGRHRLSSGMHLACI